MLDLILLLTPELDSFHLIGESEASFHNNARDELMHNSHLVLPYFIEQFYDLNTASEWGRLDRHRTEFAVTMRVLHDYIPTQPVDILDVGSGPGRYAIALARHGHRVTLVDLSKKSLDYAKEQAQKAKVELAGCVRGNAVSLSGFENATFSVVLLLGPLYHLQSETERQQAVRESRRVLRPGGIILASFITRYAPFRWAAKNDPSWMPSHRQLLETGVFIPSMGPKGADRGFTDAYFASPGEVKPLMEQEGFETLDLIGCEGIVSLIEEKVNALTGREFDEWVELNRQLGRDPSVQGACEHLLYVGKKVM